MQARERIQCTSERCKLASKLSVRSTPSQTPKNATRCYRQVGRTVPENKTPQLEALKSKRGGRRVGAILRFTCLQSTCLFCICTSRESRPVIPFLVSISWAIMPTCCAPEVNRDSTAVVAKCLTTMRRRLTFRVISAFKEQPTSHLCWQLSPTRTLSHWNRFTKLSVWTRWHASKQQSVPCGAWDSISCQRGWQVGHTVRQ